MARESCPCRPLCPTIVRRFGCNNGCSEGQGTSAKPNAIPEDRWAEIVARAEREGLRPSARDFGVSHEAIRAVLQAAGCTDLLANVERKHRLAAAIPSPPPARCKISKERYGEVILLFQRHTQAEVAAMLGVSQATCWRILRRGIRAPGGTSS